MYCEKCGAKLSSDMVFCERCGQKVAAKSNSRIIKSGDLKKKQGNQNNQHNQHNQHDQKTDKPKKQNMPDKPKKRRIWLVVLIIVAIVAAFAVGGYLLYRSFHTTGFSDTDAEVFSDMDAESYFHTNAQVISEQKADKSEGVETEQEAYDSLKDRGFMQTSITSTYTMQGEYVEEEEIEGDSTEKHPMYETYYISANDELWTIYSINGEVMAYPVSYNLESDLEVPVIVSESETVVSYDGETNTYYETIPNRSASIVITIEKIDSAALDNLTVEEIDRYVREEE